MTLRERLLTLLLLVCGVAQAGAPPVELGVLAARPKPVMRAHFEPFAAYLSTALGGVPVTLQVLDQDELQDALRRNALDLLLTNPISYLELRSRNSLSGVLATVRMQRNGTTTTQQGGVIVTRADRPFIVRLADLRGRRVAVPSLQAFGGYLAPLLELQAAGLRVPAGGGQAPGSSPKSPRRDADLTLQPVGSHDAVVDAVLGGRVDAGFVRSGLLEALAAKGRLDPAQLRIVNRQALADYPFAVSTRLYPDWPLVALPRLDDDAVRRVTAAALALDADHPVARAADIAGFAPPADYLPVENLARALRLPPYDQAPPLRWSDLWQRHRPTVLVLAAATAALLALLVQLAARNRALRRSQAALTAAVAEQRALLSAMPFPVFEVDADGHVGRVWARSDRVTRIDPQRVLGLTIGQLLPADAAGQVVTALAEAAREGLKRGVQVSVPNPAGGTRDIDLSISAIGDGAAARRFVVLTRDVTAERENQRWLAVAASVFTHAGEGILISDPDNRILAVNQAFTRILGYPDDTHLIGHSTAELSAQFLGGESYASLRHALRTRGYWHGEIRGQRADGSFYTATLNSRAAHDADGRVTHHVAILTDVTLLKAQQEQLAHIAYHDPLTGLPNRALLADRLQQAMTHINRHGGWLAVAYIDLDGFKAINDTHGHHIGDRLLTAVAGRMKTIIRDGDTLARLGGDEFVAVLTNLADTAGCLPIVERLLAAAGEPVIVDHTQLRVTASIGVTFYPQAQASSAEQLLRQADNAMYMAKLGGSNRYRVYGTGASGGSERTAP